MLTPEQVADLIDHFGGQKPAARALGIPASTLRYWLDPETTRARMRRGYQADPEAGRERNRSGYHSETGLQRNWRLLRMRRTRALLRRAERNKGR